MTIRRTFFPVTCVVLGCAVYVSGQQPASPGEATEQPMAMSSEATLPASASARAAESLLRKRVDAVNWTDKPFEEIIDWLRDEGEDRVNILTKWAPLGVESVSRDSTVSLELRNTTVAEVLNETLSQLSENDEITFRGEGNKLVISTRQDFGRKFEMRVYNATDLLFRVPDFGQEAPIIDLQRTSSSGGGGGGGGGSGQSVFGGAGGGQGGQENESGQQAEQQIEQRLTKLRDAIQRTVAPDSWDRTGIQGAAAQATVGRGRIEIYGRSLIVTNTIEVHEAIAGRFTFGE